MQTTELPTRATFIAGLAPEMTDIPEGTECSICISSPTEPVKLPCGHIFDRECITGYLTNGSKNNSCPNCRQKLFICPFEEQTLVQTGRHALVSRAVRAAGLAFDQPQQEIETFGFTNPSESSLARAIPNAQNYLITSVMPNFGAAIGPALVRSTELKARIVAMGNILPHLASLQSRPYNAQQMADWKALLSCLQSVLSYFSGKEMDALVLPRQLRNAMAQEAEKARILVAATGFFESIEYRAMNNDLDTLLSCIAQSAANDWTDRRAAERRQAQAARLQAMAAQREPQRTTRVNRILREPGVCSVM